jgi:hypothetical protein
MKKLLLLSLITFFSHCLLYSQENNKKFSVSASGGIAFPVFQQSFKKSYDAGYNFAGQIELSGKSPLLVGMGIDYSKYENNKMQKDLFNVRIMIFQANAKYDLFPEFIIPPYLIGGIGLASTSIRGKGFQGKFALPFDETSVSFSIGLGFEYERFFVESKYNYIDNQKIDINATIPVRIGFRL